MKFLNICFAIALILFTPQVAIAGDIEKSMIPFITARTAEILKTDGVSCRIPRTTSYIFVGQYAMVDRTFGKDYYKCEKRWNKMRGSRASTTTSYLLNLRDLCKIIKKSKKKVILNKNHFFWRIYKIISMNYAFF